MFLMMYFMCYCIIIWCYESNSGDHFVPLFQRVFAQIINYSKIEICVAVINPCPTNGKFVLLTMKSADCAYRYSSRCRCKNADRASLRSYDASARCKLCKLTVPLQGENRASSRCQCKVQIGSAQCLCEVQTVPVESASFICNVCVHVAA